MSHLKLLPKPEGHDINVRRANKEEDASKWLPQDALYEASELMSKGAVTGAVIIAWYEKCECGSGHIRMRMRQWNERGNDSIALAAEIFSACVPKS